MTAPPEPLITKVDVEDRLGETLADPEVTQVESLIAYASSKLRSRRYLDVDARMFDGTLDRALVKGTVVTAVIRALEVMRTGLRVRSTQYPENTEQYVDADPRLIYFTDEELGELDPDVGETNPGAFTIRVF
ncbi:hypothetical protein JWS13_39140 [Rhodococcus pseudokoreensis]|uniref:Head-to-tail adaptor n=1 Tax=Rhodococcus pseudokoreensis TaxID=2811421 RepID=A0A974WAK2_9NOCA|nr:hypothetical protein [Rhodococcus pseudokoreensis]QSE94193.1 hypothetical protein JWS13_39140 [Rhodococcus pseudokoreensis]